MKKAKEIYIITILLFCFPSILFFIKNRGLQNFSSNFENHFLLNDVNLIIQGRYIFYYYLYSYNILFFNNKK